jgi:integrase
MRHANKLSVLAVSKLTVPGRYAVGDGAYLQVSPGGTRSWLFRYKLDGRARHMGLGPFDLVSLAEARQKAQDARRNILDGIDPLEAKQDAKARRRSDAAKLLTFKDCADRMMRSHSAAWKNPKHRQQWQNTLATYVYPIFGDLPVQEIDPGLVLRVLEPIWTTKPETAGRVRGRIEAVLDWAKARGTRTGENPARWRGHLDKLLPNRSKVAKVRNHPAMPYGDVPAFMGELRGRNSTSARALEFAILTAARTGEVIGARWSELDLDAGVWTIPAERMKAGKEHRVPLTGRALDLASSMDRESDFVFPGGREGKPLSNMAMAELMKGMRPGLTVHGFRSSFRDWAAESTSFPSEVVEMALAHAIESKVEAAYRRGDLFEKRRALMAEWVNYLGVK